MQNTTETGKVSELVYQGPLIGMRSTRTKPEQASPSSKTPPAKQ
jgi:hypothetical protein